MLMCSPPTYGKGIVPGIDRFVRNRFDSTALDETTRILDSSSPKFDVGAID
jgi:hypothetical protein